MRPIINNLTSNLANPLIFSESVTPDSYKLCLWLDSSDAATITESGGIVSQINDKSGEGNNFTAIGSPVTNASITNSLNVIDFSGSSGLTSASNFKLDQSFTVYAVAKVRVIDNTADALFSILDSIGNKFNIQANNSNKFDGTAESNLHSNIIPSNAPYEYNYYIYQYSVDATNNLAKLYINGVQVGQVAYTGSIQEEGTIRIGVDSTATNYADCSLAEFKFYSGILPEIENTTIIDDLTSKWAILDPRAETNIKAVYDPSNINSFQTIGAATKLITQLDDLSTNNLNLVSNTSFEPQTLASTQNNLNLINFSGTYLENLSYTMGNTCSFFVVSNVAPLVTNAAQSLFSYDDVASSNDFQLDAGSATQFNPRINGGILSSAANASTPPYQGSFKVYHLRLNRNTNAASLLIDDQVKINVFYANDLSSGNSNFRLASNRAVSQFLINDFAEAIIIDGDVSASKSTEIYNYLKGKWNI
jgi:hypothetical protein